MKQRKPQRPCPFCDKVIGGGKLKRHITRKHKQVPEVKAALLLSPTKQKEMFTKWRSDGIYQRNIVAIKDRRDDLLRERRKTSSEKDELRMCTKCKKFISKKGYHKHRHACDITADPLRPCLLADVTIEDDFSEEILTKFRDGEVGRLCRTDPLIIKVGQRHFGLRSVDAAKR